MKLFTKKKFDKILIWRSQHISDKSFMYILSIIVGIIAGIVAFTIKTSVHGIQHLVELTLDPEKHNVIYIIYPILGVTLAVLFIKYILKHKVEHGIPSILYAISKNQGFIKLHNLFSSVIASALTVGFGGSVGLEGPAVATGGAYGAAIGKILNLNYKQRILLLGAASAGAMSAIFKAPLAAVVFAVEVIMLDLTLASIVPLLLSSVTAYLTSLLLLGKDVLMPIQLHEAFVTQNLFWYVLLGILSGFMSVHFTKTYVWVYKIFNKIKKNRYKLIIGGLSLGLLIFLFPALYGEGYSSINSALAGHIDFLFDKSLFNSLKGNMYIVIILMIIVTLLKAFATAITFASGGVGGIFAPTLFTGVNTGLLFAFIINQFLGLDLPEQNFAFVGMGGLIAGVLQAPLTGMFLIANITGNYQMLVPLMITTTISFATVRYFIPNNVYSIQLAERGELMTHHADKNILQMMRIDRLIETDFITIAPNDTLRTLVDVFSRSHRNIFPVVDTENNFIGLVKLDHIRKIIFKHDKYDNVFVKDLMKIPTHKIDINEPMDVVAKKFQTSGRYNLVVLQNNKYLGFVSRDKVFSTYRQILNRMSEE